MRLTPFGEKVRTLRLRFDITLKEMAEFMGISSSHLSGIEYGEKRLARKHIDKAIAFFSDKITKSELDDLGAAAEKSRDIVQTSDLSSDARGLVAAFARRLQEGNRPPEEIVSWINSKQKERKK